MAQMDAAAGAKAAKGWRASPHLMLVLLAASYGLGQLDRTLMVVVGEAVKNEFALSDKQLSLLTGASFVFVYGVCCVPAGWLVDRVSRRKLLAGALALWSALTVLCGLAQSFVQLVIARAGVGAGESPNAPAAFSLIADMYPPAKRAMATAIFFIGGMLGLLAAFLMGAWITEHYGWRAAFLVAGAPGLFLALAILWLAPRTQRAAAAAGGSTLGAFRLVLGNRSLMWLISASAVSSFSAIGLVQWLPMFFMRSHGLTITQIGLLFGPALAGGKIIGMLVGGVLGNRAATHSVTRMLLTCAGIMFVVSPMFLLLLNAPSAGLALALTLATTVFTGMYSPIATAAWQTVCDPGARGTAGGLSNLLSQVIGGALLPFIVGALSDALKPGFGADSLRYALMASMVFCLTGSGLFLIAARYARPLRS